MRSMKGRTGSPLSGSVLCPNDEQTGSCSGPEVWLWDITLLAKSYWGTCPRSRFLGSFTDHFDGLPTFRPSDSKRYLRVADKDRLQQ